MRARSFSPDWRPEGRVDVNFNPPGMVHYSYPSNFFCIKKKILKKGVVHYLNVHFGPTGMVHYSAPGHHKTLVHYQGEEVLTKIQTITIWKKKPQQYEIIHQNIKNYMMKLNNLQKLDAQANTFRRHTCSQQRYCRQMKCWARPGGHHTWNLGDKEPING